MVLKVGLAMLALISVVAGCDPPTTAVHAEISTPVQTVTQATRAGNLSDTPTKTAIRITAKPTAEASLTRSEGPMAAEAPDSSPKAEGCGQIYHVGKTDGDGVNIRRTRDMDDKIRAWPDGTAMIEVSCATEVGNRLWRHVVDPDGNEGYVPSEYLMRTVDQQTLVFPRLAMVPSNIPKYNRHDWGDWKDADGDCQDTRQEVLIEESTTPVKFKTAKQCRVDSGTWDGPYTGQQFTNPSDLDIDHLVPLANAHRSDGWAWSRAKKMRFANYLKYHGHLIAVDNSENRYKRDKGPEAWMPPDQGYWCEYAIHWINIKVSWNLTATGPELAALKQMIDTCEASADIVVVHTSEESTTPPATATPALEETATAAPPTATKPAPEPTATAAPALLYDPDGPDRNCGDFDTWQQAQDFYRAAGGPGSDRHRLDRDKDGIACESLPGAP